MTHIASNYLELLFRSSLKGIKEVMFDIGEITSHNKCSMKRAVLKNFATFTGKYLRWGLFLTKLQTSSKYCKIFKNSYFEEHLRTAPSVAT